MQPANSRDNGLIGASTAQACSGRASAAGSGPHVDAAGYVHAPFALAKSGEYLALIKPDGVTRTSEFAPGYPPQVTDLSYGAQAPVEALVNESTTVRFLMPTTSIPDTAATNWRAPAYNDTSWRSGVGSGVGFEQGSPTGAWLMDKPAGATGTTWHVVAGRPATMNAWTHIAITRSSSGTKQIYLNGVQAVVYEDTDISAAALPALVNGPNVLALHGFRRSVAHGDLLLSPVLEAGVVPAAQTSGFLAVATPGKSNGGAFIHPGPGIDGVAHSPAHPLQGETITVTARTQTITGSPAFGDTLYGIEKKTRLREGMGDLDEFVTGLNTGNADERKAYLFENMNLPNFINFMAMRPLISDSDTNRKNFYFYRDSNGSREWHLFPWDKDGTMMGTINPWQATIKYKAEASSTKQWNVLWEQGHQSEEIRAMVDRRLRTLMDTMMGPPGTPPGTSVLEQRMAVVRSTMTPLPPGVSVSNYNVISSWNSWLSQNRTSLYNTFGPASAYGMISSAVTADSAALITIESADPNPASGTQDTEHLVLRNAGTDAVDITGWSLRGGGINHIFKPGTVIVGTAVSTTLNRAIVCNNRAAYRRRPSAPTAAEYVLGDYDGALSARGGTVELRNSTGTMVSSFVLPVAPSAAQQQLRITKLMYAPVAPNAAELAAMPGVEAKDFEFIELRNIGATTLDLTGCRFTDGINFTFPIGSALPAGARVVVAAHPTAFDLRYGPDRPRLGPYAGVFDNAGERVRLVDAVGEEILDFTYAPGWFPSTDAGGYALVMRDEADTSFADWGAPERWALSGSPSGAPTEFEGTFSYEYAGWTNYVFTEAERSDPAVSGPDVVLNGASVSNALAYALTLDPHAPDLAKLPELMTVSDGGQTYSALRFRRWKNAPTTRYTLDGGSRQPHHRHLAAGRRGGGIRRSRRRIGHGHTAGYRGLWHQRQPVPPSACGDVS